MNNCPKCGAQMNGANCPYCGIDKKPVQQPINTNEQPLETIDPKDPLGEKNVEPPKKKNNKSTIIIVAIIIIAAIIIIPKLTKDKNGGNTTTTTTKAPTFQSIPTSTTTDKTE